MTVTIKVDDQELAVKEDQTVLQACLENDIYIPNLCFMKGVSAPQASCRLCFVEVGGLDKPVAACAMRVADQMTVRTNTPAVRRLQKTGLRLLLSVHAVDCKNCPANKNCVLQDLSKFLNAGLKSKNLDLHLKQPDIDDTHPHLIHYPNRCVLCGKCIQVCRSASGSAMLAFAKRGFDTVISFYGAPVSVGPRCENCSTCIDICPVAALLPKSGV